MIYNFDTNQEELAIAALITYCIYRSRDINKFKITFDMWDRITRFVKSSSKRSKSLHEYMESFKIKMNCESIKPKLCSISSGKEDEITLIHIINNADHNKVINSLYQKTTYIILLVQDRLNKEKDNRGSKEKSSQLEIIDN